jgi:DNA topoisomerase II
MIIDGKLVVSKKKKAVLIAELQKLNFMPIPKVTSAKKVDEDENVFEDENTEDEATEAGSADYDYLLGMPIWSLTQERIERIERQIGDKELEIDVIIKKGPKDLWNEDLDDFLAEWNAAIEDAKQRKEKIKSKGRRASAKLGTKGGKTKKRKGGSDDESDFEIGKKKSSALKAITDRAKAKGKGGVWGNFINERPSQAAKVEPKVAELGDEDDFIDIDQIDAKLSDKKQDSSEVVPVKKTGRPAGVKNKPAERPSKKPVPVDSDSDGDAWLAAGKEPSKKTVAAPRRAAAKPKKYVLDDDSDQDSFNDDNLGDITEMVKPLAQSTAAAGRALFTATTRPGSSHGATSQQTKPKSKSKSPDDSDAAVDDTDFHALLQGSPRRAVPRPGDNMGLDDDDDDDTLGAPVRKTAVPKPKAPAVKPAASTKLVAKKPAVKKSAPAPKVIPLSPAAKAYAAKQAKADEKPKAASKKKGAISNDGDDDMEDLANEILRDNEDESMNDAPVARPSRRAAVSKAKYIAESDSDEGEESEDDYDDDSE